MYNRKFIKFCKEYFHLSHQEDGYSSRFGGAVKVSKEMRKVVLINCYLLIFLSFFIFLSPFKFLINIIFWVVIIFIPVVQIFEYDFRIFKLIRLYRYSKSKNINKRIIYEGYMIDDYRKLFLDIFDNYKKKRINIIKTSLKYHADCFWQNMRLSIIVKPRIVVIKINDYKKIIKNNELDFRTILNIVSNKIKNN